MQFEKFNVHGLATSDLLRKDYKEYQFGKLKCGIAAVFLSFSKWVEMDSDLETEFDQFVKCRKLDLLVLMIVSNSQNCQRERIVFWDTEEGQDLLFYYIQENGLELTPLNTQELELRGDGVMRIYKQGNVRISRKRLQPLLDSFVSDSSVPLCQ